MKSKVTLIAFIFLLFAGLAEAQSAKDSGATVLGSKCDLAAFGEENTTRFLQFDHDLRQAIRNRDVGKLALLVEFPLRIDDEGGAIFIHDAESLQGHYDLAFPLAIRQVILSSTRDTIWCNYAGIDYGDGRVWANVTDQGIFLETVNLPPAKSPRKQELDRSSLACHTKEMRVLIDSAKEDNQRYRSWSFARSLSSPPGIEIGGGTFSYEGTGPCAHRVWTFKNQKMQIGVEEPGCYGDDDSPPSGAQAKISISGQNAQEPVSEWCF